MLITELIKQLEAIKSKHGDVPVKMCWDDVHWSFESEVDVNDIWKAWYLNENVLLVPPSTGSYKVDYK